MNETDQITKTSDVAAAPHVKNPKRVAAATRLAASRAQARQEKQANQASEEGSPNFVVPSLATALSVVGIAIGIVNIFMWGASAPHVPPTAERPSERTTQPVRRGME